MKLLHNIIMERGVAVPPNIIRVDSFLNHQIDPNLIREIGKEFANRFKELSPTKIITVESSGIAPAVSTSMEMSIPLVFAKKNIIANGPTHYFARIKSFTRKCEAEISIKKEFLHDDDRILIIDDFLATGEATAGLLSIIEQANAKIVGIGAVIEKEFQDGGNNLRKRGYVVQSLAKIRSIKDGIIQINL
jgi:xanthine phosphoribosyltransferase